MMRRDPAPRPVPRRGGGAVEAASPAARRSAVGKPAGATKRAAVSPSMLSALIVALLALLRPGVAAASELRRFVLPDRVHLLLQPEPSAELVAISICIRTEPDRSPADDATGELVARSLFSSSLNRSRERLSASISEVGGSVETRRTAEHVSITCVALPAQVREAAYLLCEVLKNADFGAIDRVRAEAIAEQRRAGNGLLGGLDILRRELQARPDLADLPFQRTTLAQAEAYFRSRYTPERTAIAVVGKFDIQSVQTAFRDSLADFDRAAPRPPSTSPLYSHATNFPTRTVAQPGASSYALVATPAPPLSDPSYPAFVVLKAILGEGHASRLFQHLRDTQGIGYSVGASWQTTLSDPMVAYLQWETRAPAAPAAEPPLDPETALRLLATEIDGLIANPPTEAEVRRARSISIGREALRHERARDRAFLLAWYEAIGAGAELDAALPSRLAAVTRVDVLSAARSYLGTRASVLIVPAR